MHSVAPPLTLYAHFPWCVRKCPYCDFNSHALHGELPESAYVTALLADLDRDLADDPEIASRPLVAIFLGGGTPSLFAPAAISALLRGIGDRFSSDPDLEITLETNPGTVEHGRFEGYREAGVTRISLGVQSFDPAALARLGRIHSSDDACSAVDLLHAGGFTNFNLDLMYGLPEQTIAQAVHDVNTALRLGAPHLSHYELTLEPNTLFHAQPPSGMPDDELAWTLQEAAHALLRGSGLVQYEVSAWAREGHRCRHNLNYWEFGDYLGIGAGAHGKLTAADGSVVRKQKLKHPQRYLDRAGSSARVDRVEVRSAQDLEFEFMLNALRLTEGFDILTYERRTGLDWRTVVARVDDLKSRGLVEGDWQRVRATPLGLRRMNDLLVEFLPEDPSKRKLAAP